MTGEHSKESGVIITSREIYDRVVVVEGMVAQLLAGLDPIRRRLDDHEGRLEKIETALGDLKVSAARSDWLPRLALGLLGAVAGGVILWLITRGA